MLRLDREAIEPGLGKDRRTVGLPAVMGLSSRGRSADRRPASPLQRLKSTRFLLDVANGPRHSRNESHEAGQRRRFCKWVHDVRPLGGEPAALVRPVAELCLGVRIACISTLGATLNASAAQDVVAASRPQTRQVPMRPPEP